MEQRAFYLVIFAALLSGVSGLLVKFMSIPATSMAAIRLTTPTILVGAFLLWKGNSLFRKGYRIMLTASAVNAIRMLFFFSAYIYTSISNAIITLYTWPIFASILSVIFLKEHISRRQMGLLLFSFVGILIVYIGHDISFDNSDFIGLTAGILSALFYASTVVIFKSQTATFKPSETIFFQNLVGTFVFLPFLFFNEPEPTTLDWTLALTHGIVIGIIMFMAFFHGLRYINASKASMITYIEVVAAMSLGYLVMGDKITVNMIIGALIIMSCTFLLKQKEQNEPG